MALITVTFYWDDSNGPCYDCGRPAAFGVTSDKGHPALAVCAVCAANRAVDGDGIIRLETEKRGVAMTYINVGAFVNGDRPPTKKALREALRDSPDTVMFDQTSITSALPGLGRYLPVTGDGRIPAKVTLTVVGPDPYRVRTWYASVTVNQEGRIRIT